MTIDSAAILAIITLVLTNLVSLIGNILNYRINQKGQHSQGKLSEAQASTAEADAALKLSQGWDLYSRRLIERIDGLEEDLKNVSAENKSCQENYDRLQKENQGLLNRVSVLEAELIKLKKGES